MLLSFFSCAFVVVGVPVKLFVDSTVRVPLASSDHTCVVSAALPWKLLVDVTMSLAPSHLTWTFPARPSVRQA